MSEQRPGLGQVIKSILWAALGVQSEENRRRDFTQGRPGVYIAVGLGFVVVFVVVLVVVVNLVLRSAGL